jgi:O-methyltransferase
MNNETKNTNRPIDTVSYGETVIPQNRLDYLTWKCRETLERNPGNVLEVGVYKGGTLLSLTKVVEEICPQFKVYGVDTFVGHPYTDGHPVHPKGKYGDINKEKLEKFIESKHLDKWVTLFDGKIEEIFKQLELKNISFAHIDCDLYIPVKYCAENVPSVMNNHGVIYFDDYGHEHCPGATKAVEEVFEKYQIHRVYIPDDDTCWSGYVQL